MNKKVKKYSVSICLLLALSVHGYTKDIIKEKQEDRYAKRIEKQADRKFIEQDFEKSMKIYESSFKNPLSNEYAASLHLKIARLYLTLLDYNAAIPHYESAMFLSENIFDLDDVCYYLDALRCSGQKAKALGVANKYIYLNKSNSNRRYQNIVYALNFENSFLPIGVPEFNVRPVENINSDNSEFWVGAVQNKYFYATSNSPFHDPGKKFYHRTKYYSLEGGSKKPSKNHETKKKGALDEIPVYLQNGPVSFSEDMSKMIVTDVVYDKGENIVLSKQGISTFQTKLYYSEYNSKRKGWSSYKEAFPQKYGASYSHPFLFNNDRSILFSSNMNGGIGGYDIYIAHWNDNMGSWGEPINMGPQINTEGDEISPCIFENMLIFSSNGHAGLGGYDLYTIDYIGEQVIPGSFTHFDYPINTPFNDYRMLHIDANKGYIVSDRTTYNKDDIFYFERNTDFGNSNLLYGMSEARAISNGAINLTGNTTLYTINSQKEVLPKFEYTYDYNLSLFFDFDQYELPASSSLQLNTYMRNLDLTQVDFLRIEGYADEMGTDSYNYNLSVKRAQAVVQWLEEQGIDINTETIGRGKVYVKPNDSKKKIIAQNESTDRSSYDNFWDNRIWENRTARRVDIKAIIK